MVMTKGHKLVMEAIKVTGSHRLPTISLYIENKITEQIQQTNIKYKAPSVVFGKMARFGLGSSSDIQRIIDELTRAMKSRSINRRGRLLKALGGGSLGEGIPLASL